MRRGATREEIISTTQSMIVRRGIRAVRVDEIARMLSISKRTLYETFADKTALVITCLEDLSCRNRSRIADCMQPAQNPLEQVLRLINEYTKSLWLADMSFLREIESRFGCAERFEEDQQFWAQVLSGRLTAGVGEGYVLPDIACDKVSGMVFETLYRMRLSKVPKQEQSLFARTILRGIASRRGIEWIDARL